MNGADIVVKHLLNIGVDRVFTLCGNGLDPFHDACDRAGLELVDTHNEQAAGYMADAHGRLTRRIGVCAVSSGVAHVNALTGVANAHFDGSPMLLLTGASPQTTYGLGHFQEMDQVAVAQSLCKLARRVENLDQLGRAIDEACTVAMSGRPGPVHLTIPIDVFKAEVEEDTPFGQPLHNCAAMQTIGEPEQIGRSVALLDEAQQPVIVAGSGVYYGGGEKDLTDFAAKAAIPIVVPIWDRGSVRHPCREFAGFVGAASGEPRLLADADLLILAGARVDYRVGYLKPPAVREDLQLIRISADPGELAQGRRAEIAILGNPGSVLREFTEQVSRPHTSWCEEALRRAEEFRALWPNRPSPSDSRLTGRNLVEILKPFITDKTLLLIDGGDIGQWAHIVLADRYPGYWLTCGASAVVGYGLPAAIAAKKAYPDRPVILLSGDGAAGFTIAELEVAVRHKAPLVMVIADDEAWGIVAAAHKEAFGKPIASKLGPIRWDQVAAGFGAKGVRTSDPEELTAALRESLASNHTTLIQVPLEMGSPTERPDGSGEVTGDRNG